MAKTDDTTFFTNEPGSTLLGRFKKILKDAQYFDVLVGFFRTSGFYHLYKSLESIEKIRILVGLNVDKRTYEIIETSRTQGDFDFESHSKTKRLFIEQTASEMGNSEDTYETEIGIKKFLEFLTLISIGSIILNLSSSLTKSCLCFDRGYSALTIKPLFFKILNNSHFTSSSVKNDL